MGSGMRYCFNAYQLCDRTHKWDKKAITLESLGDGGELSHQELSSVPGPSVNTINVCPKCLPQFT